MPADIAGTLAKAQEQSLEALKEAQELSLRAFETALELVPSDPTFGLAGSLPTPRETIEASFGFAERVLDQQKEFALRVTELLTRPKTPSAS